MKHIIYLFLSTILLSCGRFENTNNKNNLQERIVCISKQYSEIIFALKAQKNIVAVDLSSTFPDSVKKLPTVGYHRALSAETILAMNPTLILHDNNIGPEHVVEQLNNLKIPMKTFGKYSSTIEGTDSLIREIGSHFNKVKEADYLCEKLKIDMDKALNEASKYSFKPRVLIIHFGRATNSYLVITKKSTAAKMLQWAGGEIAVDSDKGMKQISPEIVAAAKPDVILLTDFGYDKLNNGKEIEKLPGVSSTKAFKNNAVYRIEEHDLVYLGPRTGENVLLIQKLIHKNETK